MPVMDGFAEFSAIKALEKQFIKDGLCETEIPIVASTSFSDDANLKKCLDMGMVDVLSTPITQDALKACIQKHYL